MLSGRMWKLFLNSIRKDVLLQQQFRCCSYVHCVGKEPLLNWTVGQVVDSAAEKWGTSRKALVSCHQNESLTFSELRSQSDHLAAGLLEMGLSPGDRLAIWSPNCTEWILTQMAAAKAGVILVNINPAYKASELLYCIQLVNARALIAIDRLRNTDTGSIAAEVSSQVPGLSVILISDQDRPKAFLFSDVAKSASSQTVEKIRNTQKSIQSDDPHNIQFTSGTTGKPKGAVLSHFNVVNNSYSFGKRLGLHLQESKLCIQVPLFHCFGCVVGVLAALHNGATIVLPSQTYDTVASIKAIEQQRCTHVYGTPTMYVDMLASRDLQLSDVSSLQVAVNGGANCPESLFNEMKKQLGVTRLSTAFGMTETSPVTFSPLPTDNLSICTTTLGYPLDHIEVKVVDSEGRVVPRGQSGELLIRGVCNMLGYWNNEEKTKEMIGIDGWLKTGDVCVIEKSGHGRIVGRIKDVIIRGGENVYPKEVEDILHAHEDIIEAQIFGIHDDRLGEDVCAWIRVREGANLSTDDVRRYCKEKMAYYKVPHLIRFVTDFPKTTSGKIQKFVMKEQMEKESRSTP